MFFFRWKHIQVPQIFENNQRQQKKKINYWDIANNFSFHLIFNMLNAMKYPLFVLQQQHTLWSLKIRLPPSATTRHQL